MASLRLTIPRAGFQLHAKQLQQRLIIASIRHASTTPPPKPRVLAQPDKFRPPSHPSRLRSKTPRYQYGPELTAEQKTKKQYPHMMPPEGSFMHWFLTNRTIHLWISLVRTFNICLDPLIISLPVHPNLPRLRRLAQRVRPQHPLPRPPPSQLHAPLSPLQFHRSLGRGLQYARRIRQRSDSGATEAEG